MDSHLITDPQTTTSAPAPDELLQQYAAIIESSDDAIVAKTPQGRIASWNPGAERMFGYTETEAVGESIDLVIPENLRGEEASIRERVLAGESVKDFETLRRRRDGSVVDVSVAVSPIKSRDGRIVGISKIARDISARRQAERTMLESVRELQSFKAALDEHAIVAITDPRGDIQYVNDKFCAISQYSREELLGQNHRIINSGYHPKEFFQELWAAISSGRVWKGEIRNRAKDGTHYWVATTIVPLLGERGKARQYVSIRTDITAQKRAAEVLVRRSDDLARSNSALEEFAYVASHDLQEPLRGVSGCIQLLQTRYQGKLDASADEFISHSVTNIERMQALILGLLEYARVDRRGRPFVPVDVNQVLSETMDGLKSAIEESGAQVVWEGLPVLAADGAQLRQLLQNLIGNAIKFRGEEAPWITIAALAREESTWEFTVADNGIGIDPRHAERIFGMFQRLHTRGKYPGTGIGLALCKRIVERHGGRIWVESGEGKGSRFHFTLAGKKDVSL